MQTAVRSGAGGSPPANGQRARHAITDLWDASRRSFTFQYPVTLLIALALSGFAAFALVAFLGYRDSQELAATYVLFKQPWPLFLWFSALLVTLEATVLRHASLRRQLTAVLTVQIASILLVGAFYYFGGEITRALQNLLTLLDIRSLIPALGKTQFLYIVINFGLIAIFWADTVRRWIRGSRGEAISPRIDIGFLSAGGSAEEDEAPPTFSELVSGDLIAGAVLTALLALVFRAEVINFFSHLLQVGVDVNNCTVGWFGQCTPPGGSPTDPPTITFIDVIQSLIYLPLGLLILAITAVLSGFNAVQGVNEPQLQQQKAETDDGEAGTVSVSEQVTITLLNTLRSALNRRLRIAMDNLFFSLRNVVWPAMILLATVAVAAVARGIQRYLHLLSDQRTCTSAACPEFTIVQNALNNGEQWQNVGVAVLWGAIAIAAVLAALTLYLYNLRVAENSFVFLGLIGFIVVLTFWLFSLALSAINGLVSLTCGPNSPVCQRVPFPQPGLTTVASFVVLAVFGAIYGVQRVRGRLATAQATVDAATKARGGK